MIAVPKSVLKTIVNAFQYCNMKSFNVIVLLGLLLHAEIFAQGNDAALDRVD
jgi:hypothetical protein